MAIMTDIETRLRERLSRPGRVQISAKTWSTAYAAIGAPKVCESAEALSFAAAWSPIISRTALIPASLFVMIESSCKAQVTSPPQDYPNGSRYCKAGLREINYDLPEADFGTTSSLNGRRPPIDPM